jgi:hypothetical protein
MTARAGVKSRTSDVFKNYPARTGIMPVQLFRLRGVPDDEAEEIRELLSTNEIDYYETPAGNWGISMPAIWLNDESQLHRAQLLIEKYQGERLARVRDEYERFNREGKNKSIIDVIKQNPVRFMVYLAAIIAVIYLSTVPFIDFGK